jgi:hypothetical protein
MAPPDILEDAMALSLTQAVATLPSAFATRAQSAREGRPGAQRAGPAVDRAFTCRTVVVSRYGSCSHNHKW